MLSSFSYMWCTWWVIWALYPSHLLCCLVWPIHDWTGEAHVNPQGVAGWVNVSSWHTVTVGYFSHSVQLHAVSRGKNTNVSFLVVIHTSDFPQQWYLWQSIGKHVNHLKWKVQCCLHKCWSCICSVLIPLRCIHWWIASASGSIIFELI